ncbi:MAG TPA: DUF4013 domain-containing protein [Gemmataceae bacterium]|nr:DUF4013 domain-containing protein [Gemmataceae bacterium]
MRYLESYRYIFGSPKWLTNVVAGALAQFVPIVGPMVFTGYGFDIIEALHRNPGGPYPDFDTNLLSRYLTRGVWPFLVRLLAGFVLTPVFLALYFGGMAAIMATAGDDKSQASGMRPALILALVFVEVFLSLLLSLVIMPLELRAGLAQDFAAAFAPAWVIDFFKRVWPQLILAQLFRRARPSSCRWPASRCAASASTSPRPWSSSPSSTCGTSFTGCTWSAAAPRCR